MTSRVSIHIKCNEEDKEKYLTLLYLIKAKSNKKLNNIDVIISSMEHFNNVLNEQK